MYMPISTRRTREERWGQRTNVSARLRKLIVRLDPRRTSAKGGSRSSSSGLSWTTSLMVRYSASRASGRYRLEVRQARARDWVCSLSARCWRMRETISSGSVGREGSKAAGGGGSGSARAAVARVREEATEVARRKGIGELDDLGGSFRVVMASAIGSAPRCRVKQRAVSAAQPYSILESSPCRRSALYTAPQSPATPPIATC